MRVKPKQIWLSFYFLFVDMMKGYDDSQKSEKADIIISVRNYV